ncbi:MAG: GxxExxY protein [Planctomycetaceae bacterium]|nr:GxxExxY protein [Planctomycetaceae bacterium]
MPDVSEDSQTYAIIGAAMEVHRVLGCGFLEPVYQKAFARELTARGIPCKCEVHIPISYKEELLDCHYKADFVCYNDIIVELKALDGLTVTHESQLLNYLKASGYKRGLLINFGQTSLKYRRRVL